MWYMLDHFDSFCEGYSFSNKINNTRGSKLSSRI